MKGSSEPLGRRLWNSLVCGAQDQFSLGLSLLIEWLVPGLGVPADAGLPAVKSSSLLQFTCIEARTLPIASQACSQPLMGPLTTPTFLMPISQTRTWSPKKFSDLLR